MEELIISSVASLIPRCIAIEMKNIEQRNLQPSDHYPVLLDIRVKSMLGSAL